MSKITEIEHIETAPPNTPFSNRAIDGEAVGDVPVDHANTELNRNNEVDEEDLAELAELESAIASMKRSALRAKIEAKRAELLALQSSDAASTMPHQTVDTTPTRAPRASFTTPFTDGRPDFYKAGIRQQHRRQTLAFAEPNDDELSSVRSNSSAHSQPAQSLDMQPVSQHRSHDHPISCNECSSKPVSIAVPMPKVFDGEEPDQGKLRIQLMDFIDELEGYVTYSYSSKRQTPTPQEWLATAVRFLKGSAAAVYRAQLVTASEAVMLGERDSDLTWEDLRAALIDQFGRPLDGYDLILTMFLQLKQAANESIKQFSDRFHSHHM
jgi:hypothetical protein